MTITLHMTWWLIPLIITAVSLTWAFWPRESDRGYFGGIGVVFMLVPALLVSMISWIVAAFFK